MTLVRRCTAEGLGTAFLLAGVVGSGIMAQRLSGGNAAIALLANTLATGGVLMCLIAALGPISGAHFNPAVSLADAIRGGLKWSELPPYIVAQIIGALAGVAAANTMFGLPVFFASHRARSGPAQWFAEFVATFGLLLVIWGCVRFKSAFVPFAVAVHVVDVVRQPRRDDCALTIRYVRGHPSARCAGFHRRAIARRGLRDPPVPMAR